MQIGLHKHVNAFYHVLDVGIGTDRRAISPDFDCAAVCQLRPPAADRKPAPSRVLLARLPWAPLAV